MAKDFNGREDELPSEDVWGLSLLHIFPQYTFGAEEKSADHPHKFSEELLYQIFNIHAFN